MEKVFANYEKGKKLIFILLWVIALGGKITKQFGIVASPHPSIAEFPLILHNIYLYVFPKILVAQQKKLAKT